jgi:hypothetical protein
VRGIGGSTGILFVNAIDSWTSASRSAFQSVILALPNAQAIGPSLPARIEKAAGVLQRPAGSKLLTF